RIVNIGHLSDVEPLGELVQIEHRARVEGEGAASARAALDLGIRQARLDGPVLEMNERGAVHFAPRLPVFGEGRVRGGLAIGFRLLLRLGRGFGVVVVGRLEEFFSQVDARRRRIARYSCNDNLDGFVGTMLREELRSLVAESLLLGLTNLRPVGGIVGSGAHYVAGGTRTGGRFRKMVRKALSITATGDCQRRDGCKPYECRGGGPW